MERKGLYSYKRALEQPIWLQRINQNLSLDNPIRFSLVVYTVLVAGILYGVFSMLIPLPLPWGLKIALYVTGGYFAGLALSEKRPNGKTLPVFCKDYIKFYKTFGMKKHYRYKGELFEELKEEVDLVEFLEKMEEQFENRVE